MWSTSLPAAAATAAIVLLALPRTVTSSPYPSGSSPLSSSPPSSSIDCSSRSDGFYATGCSSSFVACTGGRPIAMVCPAELVYDEDRQKCEYPGNVIACGGEAPVEGSGIEEGSGSGDGSGEGSGVEGSGIEGSGIEGSGEGSGEIDISGACESRADGFYALETCGEQFVGCSGGVAWRMGCPASLKYDEKAQICDYPGNVAGCAEAEEGSGEEGSGIEEGSGEGSGIEEGSGEGSGTIDGSGAIDGSGFDAIYGSGSDTLDGSGSYPESDVTIEEEQEIDTEEMIVTPTGRVIEREQDVKEIEAEDDIIDDNNSVVVEEAKEEDTVEEYEVDDNTEATAGPSSTENTVVAAPAPTDAAPATAAAPLYDDVDDTPSCAGRGDGFYARGCSSELLACSNGIAHIMPCPAGLVFDESNQICDYPPHVAACSQRDQLLTDDSLLTTGDEPKPHPEIPRARDSEAAPDATVAVPTTTPVGPTVTAAAASAYAATAASPVAADGPRKSRRDARCKSSDGLFSLDCSTEFVMCRGGVATKLECGEAEAFDESSQSCLPLARHPLCFTHAIQKDDVIDDDVQMVKEKDDQADLQMPIDHSFACSFEGARAESPCADWFRLCEGGRGIEMYCLQGHLFDGETAKCVPAGQLAHCQAQ